MITPIQIEYGWDSKMKTTVKITFDNSKLPKLKDLVRSWVQLKVTEEGESSITVSGREQVIGTMLREIYFYSQRHKGTYKVDYPTALGKLTLSKQHNVEAVFIEKVYNRKLHDTLYSVEYGDIEEAIRIFGKENVTLLLEGKTPKLVQIPLNEDDVRVK